MPLVIATGETANVTVVLDLRSSDSSRAESGDSRDVTVSLAVNIEDEFSESFELRGRVREALRANPAVLNYAQTLTAGLPGQSRSVSVSSPLPLTGLKAECTKAVGVVTVEERSDTAYLLTFAPCCNAAGALSGVIHLQALAKDGQRLPDVSIPVVGEVMSELRVIPEKIDFEALAVGQALHGTFAIQSALGRPCQLVELKADDDVLELAINNALSVQRVDEPRTRWTVNVRFTPCAIGFNTTDVLATLCDADGQMVKLSVPVSAFVVAQPPSNER